MIYNCHNKYNIKIIKNNQIVGENTFYNVANSGIYLQRRDGSPSDTVTLLCEYTDGTVDENNQQVLKEIAYSSGVQFYRITEPASVIFNSDITFTGSLYMSGFGAVHDATSQSWSISLGSPLYEEASEGQRPIPHYWSEIKGVNFSAKIDRNTTIQMTITVYFNVTEPSGSHFIASINPILGEGNSFPFPFVSSFKLSPLINMPTTLVKQIPTTYTLSSVRPEQAKYDRDGDYVCQPNNILQGLFIDFSGSPINLGRLTPIGNLNVGSMPTLVYDKVCATRLPAQITGQTITVDGEQASCVPVPVAELNVAEINRLLQEYSGEDAVYLYASIPDGARMRQIRVNGLELDDTGINCTWIEMPNVVNLSGNISQYLDDDNKDEVNMNSDSRLFYSNFILSRDNNYWEPANGCPVTSTRITLPTGIKPTNYRMGKNIRFYFEGRESEGEWTPCKLLNPDTNGGPTSYKVYYLQKEDYNEYRIIFTAIPSTDQFGYYVNKAEETHIPNKTYDKNVILINTSTDIYDENNNLNLDREAGLDLGRCGIRITKEVLTDLKDRLSGTVNSSYYIYVMVSTPDYFYKTKDTTAILNYSFSAHKVGG